MKKIIKYRDIKESELNLYITDGDEYAEIDTDFVIWTPAFRKGGVNNTFQEFMGYDDKYGEHIIFRRPIFKKKVG